MPGFETLLLNCLDGNRQMAFYQDVLGMKVFAGGLVGYSKDEVHLHFLETEKPYEPSRHDRYWKITIAVPDVELACDQLRGHGVKIDGPKQFLDIGYVAHFHDPEGFVIELIGHGFEGEPLPNVLDRKRLGGGPHLNLVTLRCADLDDLRSLSGLPGLKCLAVMPVEEYGFTLHFFAFTDEEPPSSDLKAVENRTWLYQRPYTVLEIQYRPSLGLIRKQEQVGYEALLVSDIEPLEPNPFYLRPGSS